MGKKLSIFALFTLASVAIAHAGTDMLVDNSAQYPAPQTRVYAQPPAIYYAPRPIVVVAPAYHYYQPRVVVYRSHRVCGPRFWH